MTYKHRLCPAPDFAHGVLAAVGRHRGSHHSGRHGPRWGGPGGPFDSDGSPFGRKLGSDDLQLVLLALLEKQPAHGYELIRALEERSSGFYKPSSGMVYPALTYLDEIGHVSSQAEGNRKLYTLTEAGLAHLAANRANADTILDALGRIGSRMSAMREAFSSRAQGGPALEEARNALRQALGRADLRTQPEVDRVAAVLRQAAEAIARRPATDA